MGLKNFGISNIEDLILSTKDKLSFMRGLCIKNFVNNTIKNELSLAIR